MYEQLPWLAYYAKFIPRAGDDNKLMRAMCFAQTEKRVALQRRSHSRHEPAPGIGPGKRGRPARRDPGGDGSAIPEVGRAGAWHRRRGLWRKRGTSVERQHAVVKQQRWRGHGRPVTETL